MDEWAELLKLWEQVIGQLLRHGEAQGRSLWRYSGGWNRWRRRWPVGRGRRRQRASQRGGSGGSLGHNGVNQPSVR